MVWDGSTVYTIQEFKPQTSLSLSWHRKSDGNWAGVDRSGSEDMYEADVMFRGPLAELVDLETVLDGNRENFNVTCGSNEEIFGADIDYSGALDITVASGPKGYGKIKHTASFASFEMPLRLHLLSPSFIGSPSITSLRRDGYAYEAGSEFSLGRAFALDGSVSYNDAEIDPGIFRSAFKQTFEEMKAIRRYLTVTARTATLASFDYSAFGITEPFGQRMGSGAPSGQFDTKIISWKDRGKLNFIDWGLEITFARVI